MAQAHLLRGFRSSVNSAVSFSPFPYLFTTVSAPRETQINASFTSGMVFSFTPAPAPREIQMLIGPIAEGWTLNRPLMTVIEIDDDGTYLMSDDEFAVYGEGMNREEAVRDYVVSLIEYFQLLEARATQHFPTAVLFHRLRCVLNRTKPAKTGSTRLAV